MLSLGRTVNCLISLEQAHLRRVRVLKHEDGVDQISTGLDYQAKTKRFDSAEADRPPTTFDKERDITKWES